MCGMIFMITECLLLLYGYAELLHTTSVQNMGNYQEYVKRLPPPMREIETQPARQHTFGNPFKVNKVIEHTLWFE